MSAWQARGEPNYVHEILEGIPDAGAADNGIFGTDPEMEDELYDQAVEFVTRTRKASISSVQRELRIGYNRAARIIEAMESAGLVSPPGTNGTREVLVAKAQ